MITAKTIEAIEMPAELWMLHQPDIGFILSADDAPEGRTLLVATSEAEAIKAAEYQNHMFELECVPVRVFPREGA